MKCTNGGRCARVKEMRNDLSDENERANSQTQVLVAEDLEKTYGPRTALRGLSFSLKAGASWLSWPQRRGENHSDRILTTIMEPSSATSA